MFRPTLVASLAVVALTATLPAQEPASKAQADRKAVLGGRLAGLVGHTIEVVGITSDTKLNNTDAFHSTIGSSARDRATLTVRSVTTIAATCR